MSSNTSSPFNPAAPESQLAAEILAVAAPLRGLVSGLVPKDVPLPWAPEVLAAFVEVQRIAESGRVLMTARAAEAGVWQQGQFPTAADWLARQQGTTTGRAQADLETSERLGGLDATSDAVRAGLLSPEQAGAVADASAVNPAAERDLLDRAQRDSLRRTRLEAERRKAEAQSEADKAQRDARVRKERDVRFTYRNGAGTMIATGPVADLKELEQWIQREVDRQFRANRAPAQRGSRGNYAFDALVDLGRNGGRNGSGEGGGAKRSPLTRMTLIRVDLAALVRGQVGEGELCEIGGVSVSVTELRRLLGDSILQLVLTNGEAVIDVVNLGRKPTVAQMLAKLFTDSTCCVEGCDRAARLEFDHRDDWVRVLTTQLENLDLLCNHHHDLKTYQGWQLVEGSGRRPMVAPDDPRHPAHSADAGAASGGQRVVTVIAPESTVPANGPATESQQVAGSGPRTGDTRTADLAARLARIRAREARHQARLAGQDQLFDTG